MTSEMTGVIRHLLTFAGGVFVTMGYIDAESVNQLTGAVLTIIGIGWSVVAKRKY